MEIHCHIDFFFFEKTSFYGSIYLNSNGKFISNSHLDGQLVIPFNFKCILRNFVRCWTITLLVVFQIYSDQLIDLIVTGSGYGKMTDFRLIVVSTLWLTSTLIHTKHSTWIVRMTFGHFSIHFADWVYLICQIRWCERLWWTEWFIFTIYDTQISMHQMGFICWKIQIRIQIRIENAHRPTTPMRVTPTHD